MGHEEGHSENAGDSRPQVALPESMRYSLGSIDAIPAQLTLRRFDAPAGTYDPSGSNEVRISVQADGFLDTNKSYLYFTILNTTTGGTNGTSDDNITLQGDASCLIEQLRIESQGVELERLEEYGLWNGLDLSWNSSISDINANSATTGARAVDSTADLIGINPAGANISGKAGAGGTLNVALPLKHSGFLFNHHGKAIPQGAAQFEIRMRLCPKNKAVFCDGAGAPVINYSLSNFRLYCPVYRVMDASIMNQYRSLLGQRGISFTSDSYKTYINTLTASTGTQVVQINDRSTSLLALISSMRTEGDVNTADRLGLLNHTLHGCDNFVYRVGGVLYPESQIDVTIDETATQEVYDVGRCYTEQHKAMAHFGYKKSETQVSFVRYIKSGANVDAGTKCSMGALCVDLRTFDSSRLQMVGLNTAKNSVPNTIQVQTTAGNMDGQQTLTTFAKVEVEYFMSPDGRLTSAY